MRRATVIVVLLSFQVTMPGCAVRAYDPASAPAQPPMDLRPSPPAQSSATPPPVQSLTPAEAARRAEEHFRVAQVAQKAGNAEIAISEIEKAVGLQPDNALLHYNKAQLYRERDPFEAHRALDQAAVLGLDARFTKDAAALRAELKYAMEVLNRQRVKDAVGRYQAWGSPCFLFTDAASNAEQKYREIWVDVTIEPADESAIRLNVVQRVLMLKEVARQCGFSEKRGHYDLRWSAVLRLDDRGTFLGTAQSVSVEHAWLAGMGIPRQQAEAVSGTLAAEARTVEGALELRVQPTGADALLTSLAPLSGRVPRSPR